MCRSGLLELSSICCSRLLERSGVDRGGFLLLVQFRVEALGLKILGLGLMGSGVGVEV